MSFKTKKLASAHVGRKLGAALSSAVLVAPTVMAAVPTVALAKEFTLASHSVWSAVVDSDIIDKVIFTYVRKYTAGSGSTNAESGVMVQEIAEWSDSANGFVYTYKYKEDATKDADSGDLVAIDDFDSIPEVGQKLMQETSKLSSIGYHVRNVTGTSSTGYKYVTSAGTQTETEDVNANGNGEIEYAKIYASTTGQVTIEGISDTALETLDDIATLTAPENASNDEVGTVYAYDSKGYIIGKPASGYASEEDKVGLSRLAYIEVVAAGGYHFNGDWGDVQVTSTSARISKEDLIKYYTAKGSKLTLAPKVNGNSYTVTLDAKPGSLKKGASSEFALAVGTDATAGKTTEEKNHARLLAAVDPVPAEDETFLQWQYTDEDGDIWVFAHTHAADETTTWGDMDLSLVKVSASASAKADELKRLATIDVTSTAAQIDDEVKTVLDFLSGSEDGTTIALKAIYGADRVESEKVTYVRAAADASKGSVMLATGLVVTDSNGGRTGADGLYVDATAAPLPGHTFAGWYLSDETLQDGDEQFVTKDLTLTRDAQLKALHVLSDGTVASATFTAKWDSTSAKIHFDLGDAKRISGSPELADRTFVAGSFSSATAGIYTKAAVDKSYYKDNMDFVGWSTEPNGGGTIVNAQNADKLLASDSSAKTLYAVWEAADGVRILNFVAQTGGSVSKSQIVAKKGEKLPVFSVTATAAAGYTFKGWALQAPSGRLYDLAELDAAKTGLKSPVTTYTGVAVDQVLATVNANKLIDVSAVDLANVNKKATVTFVAKFAGNKYTAIFGDKQVKYTVGVAADLEAGSWQTADGKVIASKADLDALATEDGAVIQLKAAAAVKAGWYKDADGDYHYATAVVDGERVDAKGWSRGGTTKYYYYFDLETGKMLKNAWTKSGAYWYHFGARGAMEHDRDIAYKGVNYWLNSRGAATKKA